MAKNSFVLYTDYLQHIKLLSPEEKGTLFEAILLYAAGEETPFLSPAAEMAFSFIKSRMDTDAEQYRKTCEARKEAGKLGGRPKANGFEEKQIKANKANGFFDNQSKAKKPDNDNDLDNDLKENTLKGVKEKRFEPPTQEEVAAYCLEKGYPVDAERFIDFYEAKGWMIGKNKMKDWEKARVTSTLLAQSTSCNPVVIRYTLSALKKAGLISVERGKGGARLEKDPEEITLYEIYSALEPEGLSSLIGIHSCAGSKCPIARNIRRVLQDPYQKIEESIKNTMEGITLASMIETYHQGAEEPEDAPRENPLTYS